MKGGLSARVCALRRCSTPFASTSKLQVPSCPACTHQQSRVFSMAPTIPFSHGSSRVDSPTSQQRVSSWAHSFFGSRDTAPATDESQVSSVDTAPISPELQSMVNQLVTELKFKTPNAKRVWTLFTQLDLQGATYLLSPFTLHAVLAGLHYHPSRAELNVAYATDHARAYAQKVDRIVLCLRRAGGRVTSGDLSAMAKQYALLKYAPGAVKVWHDAVELECSSPRFAHIVFDTMIKWIALHEASGGRELARVAATPLVELAVAILDNLDCAVATDDTINAFFTIILRARAHEVFSVAIKSVYGFDMEFPGAEFNPPQAKTRLLGDRQVLWILEMLDAQNRLSSMIAAFEVFDTPTPPPGRFDHFFSPGATPVFDIVVNPNSGKSLVTSVAFAVLIEAAMKAGRGAIARHYFDQLWERWAITTHHRLARAESQVDISFVVPSSENWSKIDESAWETITEPPVESVELPATGQSIDASASSSNTPLPSPSSLPPPAYHHVRPWLNFKVPIPTRDYFVSSRLIANMGRAAKQQYDFATSRFVRHRTQSTLRLMEENIRRLIAIMDKFASTSTVTSAAAAATATGTPKPASFMSLEVEMANSELHLRQLRLIFNQTKADSTVIGTWRTYRRVATTALVRKRRFEAMNTLVGGKQHIIDARLSWTRKERHKTQLQILLVKQRIQRLQKLGKATPGSHEYETCIARYRELLIVQGIDSTGKERMPAARYRPKSEDESTGDENTVVKVL